MFSVICLVSWAEDKTVSCMYSDTSGNNKEYDKFGVVWVDKEKGLMCWGPTEPDKKGKREVKRALGVWKWSGVLCLTSDIQPKNRLSASSPKDLFSMIKAQMEKIPIIPPPETT